MRKTTFSDEVPLDESSSSGRLENVNRNDTVITTTAVSRTSTTGEAVVDAVWSTAHSLLGVTMAMLGGEEKSEAT